MPSSGFLLDVAVSRALIVVELALGGLLAERLHQIDSDLIELHGAALDTVEHDTLETALPLEGSAQRPAEGPGARPAEGPGARPAGGPGTRPRRTSPRTSPRASCRAPPASTPGQHPSERPSERIARPLSSIGRRSRSCAPNRPVTSSGESSEVLGAITKAITIARGRLSQRAELVAQILVALETVATDSGGNFAAAVLAARELYGVRSVDNAGVMPLFDAFDKARVVAASSVHQVRTSPAIRVRVLRALCVAHQRLVAAATGLVLEAVVPFGERLREVQGVTGELRDAVAKAEQRRADLERKFATIVDPSLAVGCPRRNGVVSHEPIPTWPKRCASCAMKSSTPSSTAIAIRPAPRCSRPCCAR